MLELKDVSSGYGGKPVLRDISLAFPPGRVLAIVGPNGCGKSTLFKTAVGLLPCAAGEILLDGRPLSLLPPKEIARNVAYLPQHRNVADISVWRMALHGRFPHMGYPRRVRDEDRAVAWDALEAVGMAEHAHRAMKELSGGQRQKVYIAMALVQQSETILMDEPTTWLDAAHQLQVMALCRTQAAQGKAVALVLHDLPLALQNADAVAVLREGRVARAGTPEEIYECGVVPEVFGVQLKRVRLEDGWQYFCTPMER